MKILYSHFDFKKEMEGNKNKKVCNVSIARKRDNSYHDGHIAVINEAKKLGDIVTVSCTETRYFLNLIGGNVSEDKPWDKEEFYSFISGLGNKVDYVLEINNGLDVLDGFDLESAMSLFDLESQIREYQYALPSYRLLTKLYCMWGMALKYHEIPKHYTAESWKDGYYLFCIKDFVNRNCGVDMNLIDPIKDKDDIPFGSSQTPEDIAKIKEVKTKLDTANKESINDVKSKVTEDSNLQIVNTGIYTRHLKPGERFLEMACRLNVTKQFNNFTDYRKV